MYFDILFLFKFGIFVGFFVLCLIEDVFYSLLFLSIISGFITMCFYLGTVHLAPTYNPKYKLTGSQAHGVCVLSLMAVQLICFLFIKFSAPQKGFRKTWQHKLNDQLWMGKKKNE